MFLYHIKKKNNCISTDIYKNKVEILDILEINMGEK